MTYVVETIRASERDLNFRKSRHEKLHRILRESLSNCIRFYYSEMIAALES